MGWLKKKADQIISIRLGATVTSILLFLLPLVYFPGHISYTSLRYFLFGTAGLFLSILTSITWIRIPSIPRAVFRQWYVWGSVAYLGTFLVVSIASTDRAVSFFSSFQRTDGAFAIIFLILFCLNICTLCFTGGEKYIRRFLTASVLGAVVLSIFIFLSPEGFGNWFLKARGGATVGNSSIAGAYILWNIFFAILLTIRVKRKIWPIIAGILLVISPLFINWNLLTGTGVLGSITAIVSSARGAFLGIIFGGLIAIAIYLSLQSAKRTRIFGKVLLLLLIVATTISGYFFLKKTSSLHQGFIQYATESRFMFWDSALEGFKERPIAGWGPGNFGAVYHKFFNPEIFLPGNTSESWVDRTHNIFFESLVTGGILLTLGLCVFLISIVAAILRAKRIGKISAIEAALSIGALMGWLFQAQFVFDSILSLAMLFFVAAIAYAAVVTEKISLEQSLLEFKGKVIIAVVTTFCTVLFIYTIALPYKKDRVMFDVYNTKLPMRVEAWSSIEGISVMGDRYDSVLMFDRVYGAYKNNAESIRTGDPRRKEIIIQEIDAVIASLDSLVAQYVDDYELTLIAARMRYLRMDIGGVVSSEFFEETKRLATRAQYLSPNDILVLQLVKNISSMEFIVK